ncbi:MAG: MerR family transcriptional regulator [Sphaerobacter sp.]|nr:MerR family transcriptional regulator [Sphaerobacter sp.]
MLFRRDEVLSITGVSEAELRRLEAKRLVVPVRPWWTLGLGRYYRESHLDVIRWLVECHRAAEDAGARPDSP